MDALEFRVYDDDRDNMLRLNAEDISDCFELTVMIDNCIGCGRCVDACHQNVLEAIDGVTRIIDAEECIGCGYCEMECPMDAIELVFRS